MLACDALRDEALLPLGFLIEDKSATADEVVVKRIDY